MRIKAVDIDALIDAFRERADSMAEYKNMNVKVSAVIQLLNETADEFERVYGNLPEYIDKTKGVPS